MKEYIAETGGRYTYSDDILNLQELALSMSAVFDSCSDFIISGCEPDGPRISPGYVWLGGKVRRFEGAADAVYPYYIYEANTKKREFCLLFETRNDRYSMCIHECFCHSDRSLTNARLHLYL